MSPLPYPAADLARRLSEHAEAVCRAYLSNGRPRRRYWSAGDVANSPGRSLYVRLHGPTSGPGAAGHWTDAATGEHGDLLDRNYLGGWAARLARGGAFGTCPALARRAGG